MHVVKTGKLINYIYLFILKLTKRAFTIDCWAFMLFPKATEMIETRLILTGLLLWRKNIYQVSGEKNSQECGLKYGE
jgi:hypothetical protein